MIQSTRFFLVLIPVLFGILSAQAQHLIVGKVLDVQDGHAIEGAQIVVEANGRSALSDAEGRFSILLGSAGSYRVQVRMLGYHTWMQPIQVQGETNLEINLESKNSLSEEVIISATRSQLRDPTTATNISKEALEKVNLGQDLPVLLQMAPSVITTSDAGAGVGYTGINIRGSDATRINVTVNGVPLNDAESQGVFWVNMPDFATSVSSIQIQRGVGTSTNGPAAFGASLNIQTNTLEKDAYAESSQSIGSFQTWKSNLRAGTGLINNSWAVDVRLSRIQSDGFIDRASSDLGSSYISGGYYGKKGLLKFNFIHGTEKTYQAWNGIPESRIKGDMDAMNAFADRNELSPEERNHLLQSGSRTYNPFTYKGQTDNYKQTHYQLFYSYNFNENWLLNTGLFLTKGAGYYEEFKSGQKFSSYGLPNPIIGGDTLIKTDLIRQRWLDNNFFGATYSLQYQKNNMTWTFGGVASQYRGDHFGDVIWAKVSDLKDNNFRYYENDARKTDITDYLRLNWDFGRGILLYGDVQVRAIQYRFQGFDRNLNATDQEVQMLFFNPKAGISWQMNPAQQWYLSYGKANHEPARVDFVNSSPESRPRAEQLHNLELGWRWKGKTTRATINYYLMYYKDQLVLTGQINDVGAYIRSNVDESYRMGIELESAWEMTPTLQLFANGTISRNRILSYRYFLDNYDNGGQLETLLKNAPIAFSPDYVASGGVSWFPFRNWETALEAKWVGRQYLDNTGSAAKSIDPYQFLNFRTAWNVMIPKLKRCQIQLMVNNILDARYINNGYTYGYIFGGATVNENFYFPSAGRNFLVGVNLRL